MSDLGQLTAATLATVLHPAVATSLASDWDDGDPYASGMEALFACATLLQINRQPIPEAWHWRPAPGFVPAQVRECFPAELLQEDIEQHWITFEDLRHTGNVLLAHLDWCQTNGRSY